MDDYPKPVILDQREVTIAGQRVSLTSFDGRHILSINGLHTMFQMHVTSDELSEFHELLGGK